MDSEPGALDPGDLYRREAMAAFAHDLSTPLTSLRLVLELARRQSSDSGLAFDSDLAGMLTRSVDDLAALADALHEQSRLERGKLAVAAGPSNLLAVFEAARESLLPRIELAGESPEAIAGPWDGPRFARAIAGFVESANRMGDGSNRVRFRSSAQPEVVLLEFSSGEPGGQSRPIAADAGFAFFHARQFILAIGGAVHVTRAERFVSATVTVPR